MAPYALSNYFGIIAQIKALAIATHDDPAYLAATGQIAYQIPDGHGGFWRDATKLYEVPSIEQINAVDGPPFLAVRFGRLQGYGLDGVLQTADNAAKGPSATEPFWDWEVYSFHPYDPLNPDYPDAAQDMIQLMQAFQDPANERLKLPSGVATCQRCYVADASPVYLELLSGEPFTAAYLLIRTAEFLQPTNR